MSAAFAHGFVLALALILPIGPQNMFVLTQGATHERYRRVVPVVLVAGISDTVLISAAVGGVSVLLGLIPGIRTGLTGLGAAFLIWMGSQSWNAAPGNADDVAAAQSKAAWPLRRRVGYSLSVSWLNPHAILDTVVVIGGGASAYANLTAKWAYAVGAVLMSWLWFVSLSWLGRLILQSRRRTRIVAAMNRGSSVLMWAVAAKYLWQTVQWLGVH